MARYKATQRHGLQASNDDWTQTPRWAILLVYGWVFRIRGLSRACKPFADARKSHDAPYRRRAECDFLVMSKQRQMLLRFVLQRSHPDTAVEEGVFGAAYELRDGTLISVSDRGSLEGLLGWFDANLGKPQRLNSTKSRGYYRRRTAGISWLKPTASEHIAKMRALIAILEKNDYQVSQITTNRPGYVVFEDEHQVVAEPFRGDQN
jgi:hypothetical protein